VVLEALLLAGRSWWLLVLAGRPLLAGAGRCVAALLLLGAYTERLRRAQT
jgi:hypothetical protein